MNIDQILGRVPTGPEKIYYVSKTQLSIAQWAGGCKIDNVYYVYDPTDDTLTREAFLRKSGKRRRRRREPENPQMG